MEQAPNNPERVEKRRLLELLREKGQEDPETAKLVVQWYKEQEVLADEQGTAGARILFHMDMVDLYIATGDREGAFIAANDVLIEAQQENEFELFVQAVRMLENLRIYDE